MLNHGTLSLGSVVSSIITITHDIYNEQIVIFVSKIYYL